MAKIYTDHFKMWENAGIVNNVNEFKAIITNHGQNTSLLKSEAFEKLLKILYQLINSSIRGKVKKETVISAIEYINTLHTDVASLILDVYNILDTETCTFDSQPLERNNLAFFVKHTEKIVSDRLLKERLEIDTLQEMKVLDNKNFHTKFIKVKTKLYYKQKKFNLFREECEGYAKLITELNQEGNKLSTDYMMEMIKSLIGCFNLDPNRVLDVILDSFENHVNKSDFYIPLLKSYMPQSKTLSDVLGFKYVHCIETREITPRALYLVTAFLLQHKAILLEDIYNWLQPDDGTVAKEWEVKLNEASKRFKENSAIIVSTKEKDNDDPTIMSEEELYRRDSNQKFGLLEALLQVGEWRTFKRICDKLPQTYVMSQYPISYNLCQLIHLLIDPIYRKYYEAKHNLSNMAPKILLNSFAPKQVTEFSELRTIIFPMLYTIGSYLSYDPELVYKVIRLLKLGLIEAGVTERGPPPVDDALYFEILTVLDLTILPTLSAMPYNCCVADEIWDVLKLYPYNFRYSLYTRWKNETTFKYPVILYYNCEALKKCKEIMKKITKETTKSAGRQIGKLTHCCPGFIIEYILNQIIMFDNLIMLVVESLKYLTGLSYDFLAYCIIEILMQPNRVNNKQTNGMAAAWLVNLSVFCGSIYKKYNIELVGILQYVCNQMKNHKSFDLLVLKEIIQKMSGIEFSEDMTNEQLSAFSGGEILRTEGGYFNHIRNTKKSSTRLKDALMENNLAVSLCLLIGQQRDCIVYKEDTNVKLAGYLYDQCQDTLVQFGTFLNGVLSIEDYVTRLPPIESLLTEYHLRTDVAFFLSRPKINNAIQAKFDEIRKADPNHKKWSEDDKYQKYYNAVTAVTSPLFDAIHPLYPTKVWDNISPKFIILFWSLTLYDLEVPGQSYEREIRKLHVANLELRNSKDLAPIKIKKEQERNNSLIEKLREELKKQQEHTQKIVSRLTTEKEVWFKPRDVKTGKNETITQFLQHCLFPRCIFTMVDAMYCAKFIHVIHSLKTPNFSTLLCYDRLFCDIVYSVTLCTENEARRYGRFLCALLETVMRWHSSKDVFNNECAQYPGFITKFRVSNQFSEASDEVGYENYRHVCHKWHYKITKALVVCLESKDYIQIRNALIILIKILPHFPVMQKLSQMIEKKVEKIIEDEKKESRGLTTLAVSYNGLLKTKSPQFIREQDFHSAANQSTKTEAHNNKPVTSIVNTSNQHANIPITVVVNKDLRDIHHEIKDHPAHETDKNHESDKIRIIDLVDDKHDKNSFELVKNRDDFIDKDREKSVKDERREGGEKKSKEKKNREDKLLHDDRKDEIRQSTVYKEELTRSKSGSYRSESSNSWHDYPSPHEDDFLQKSDNYERGDGETKRRKVNSSTSSGKPGRVRSTSNSPDSYSSSDKKERRAKSKRVTRSSSVVIDLSESSKEKKRDGRKRVRGEEEEVFGEKKKKAEEKSLKSHQNGDDHSKTLYSDKHHQTSTVYVKGHDRKPREKTKSEGKKR